MIGAHTLRRAGNPAALPPGPYPEHLRPILSRAAFARAREEIGSWPGYAPTPLVSLPGLARAAGVGALHWKDEGGRFGLGSFKALGGAYAVLRLLQRLIQSRTGAAPRARDLLAGAHRELVRGVTVTCATDGNHGRSVAWGARLFGCACRIYVHERVSQGRRDAIARYGAEVVVEPGNYDDAVRGAARDAAAHGWFVVSDTSYEGYLDVPKDVMQGYALLVEEALEQMAPARPTHAFVQGGVGGLAAAVCAHLWETLGAARPRFVVVEPDKADCLLRSCEAGKPVTVHGELDTVMAGLACGEPSLLAWEVLSRGADVFLAIPDEAALECMRLLARGGEGDPPLVAGESAVAGLGGLLLACRDPQARALLRLDANSRVLLIGSEGATDPELYARIVGRSAEQVAAR